MKESHILPTYWGTYVVVGLDVVKLTLLADGSYRFNSEIRISRNELSQIVKATVAENADELIEIIPECSDIPNWLDLVKEFKNSITGKVETGLWKSENVFITDNETLEVMTTSGVGQLLEKFKSPFPRNCKVIIMDEVFSSGEKYKVIPWTFTF